MTCLNVHLIVEWFYVSWMIKSINGHKSTGKVAQRKKSYIRIYRYFNFLSYHWIIFSTTFLLNLRLCNRLLQSPNYILTSVHVTIGGSGGIFITLIVVTYSHIQRYGQVCWVWKHNLAAGGQAGRIKAEKWNWPSGQWNHTIGAANSSTGIALSESWTWTFSKQNKEGPAWYSERQTRSNF